MSEQKQQHPTSAEHGIYEISDKELELVIGGIAEKHQPRKQNQRSQGSNPNNPTLPRGYTFVANNPNNPTAGDLYDNNGKHVGIVMGNCAAGPC